MAEIFQEIDNLPGYFIGSHGTVRKNSVNIRPFIANGLKYVKLLDMKVPVHHLVVAYFSQVPDIRLIDFEKIRFKDGNKMNCKYNNIYVEVPTVYNKIYWQNETWKSYINIAGKRYFVYANDNIEDVRYVLNQVNKYFFPEKDAPNRETKKDLDRDNLSCYQMIIRNAVRRIQDKMKNNL